MPSKSFIGFRSPGDFQTFSRSASVRPYRMVVSPRSNTGSRDRTSSGPKAQLSRHRALASPCDAALAAEPLLEHVEDPLVRASFMNVLADALIASARYADAERVATQELAESERFRLRFVLPYALLNLAGAKIGVGSFGAAAAL